MEEEAQTTVARPIPEKLYAVPTQPSLAPMSEPRDVKCCSGGRQVSPLRPQNQHVPNPSIHEVNKSPLWKTKAHKGGQGRESKETKAVIGAADKPRPGGRKEPLCIASGHFPGPGPSGNLGFGS